MNLKTVACQAVADMISAGIPDLSGNVGVGQADEEEIAQWPALRIIPRRVEFEPWQEEGLDDVVDGNYELSRIGDFSGTLELRLFCEYLAKREDLEEQILQLFYTEGAPGTLVATTPMVTVSNIATLYEATVSVFLEGDLWEEEMVFQKKRMSFIDLSFSFPALIARGAYDLNSLRIDLATSLTAETPDETVEIADDGTMTHSS